MREARGPAPLEDVDLVPLYSVQVVIQRQQHLGGWTPSHGGDGRPPLPPLQSPHLPGTIQTWRWRRESARCHGRQRSLGGCSPGCAPATLRGFSGEEQGELFADTTGARQGQTCAHPLEGTSDASPSLRPESTLFLAHPLHYLPHLRIGL